MNSWYRNISIVLLCILFAGCNKQASDHWSAGSPDYASAQMWFDVPVEIVKDVDVFYILPTCIWDWKDANNVIHHFADVNNMEHREAMHDSFELARDVFADSVCNFFSPYYRQISLESWMKGNGVVDARFPFAMQDIQAAFEDFIDHKNGGRPFILAGFSQGGKGVVELLKTMPTEVYQRMVAAYVIGYRITAEELSQYTNIKAAQDSTDTGVVICYNSVEATKSICDVLSPTAICINPINWKCDQTVAMMNDSVSVKIDTTHHVLLVEGLNSRHYYEPILAELFVEGNYHLQELVFYKNWLTHNVKQRVENYNKKR